MSQAPIRQAVKNDVCTRGNVKGTSVCTQGSGNNRVRVVFADRTGIIMTVTR